MITERAQTADVVERTDAAFGDGGDGSAGSRRDASPAPSRSTVSVRRFRLLTPTICRAGVNRALELPGVVHFDEGGEPQDRAFAEQLGERPVVSAPTISSTASAPAATASASWYSSTMKSLRSSGDVDGRAHRREMREAAIEERRLGQHRDRRGAGRRHSLRHEPRERSPSGGCRGTAIAACIRR